MNEYQFEDNFDAKDFEQKAKAFINKHKNIIKRAVKFYDKQDEDYEDGLVQTIYNFLERELGDDWTTKIDTPSKEDLEDFVFGWSDDKDEVFTNVLDSMLD